jgi:uncharacterized protein
MPEQENITLIDTLYAAFLRGDLNQILDLVSDDTDWIVYGPAELPFSGHFRGKSGAKQFLEALITTQDDISAEFSDRIVQGNRVVILGNYSARIKATGKRVSTRIAHVWTVEDGKIIRFLDFFDTAAAQTAYAGS